MSIALQWGYIPDSEGNLPDNSGFIYLHAVTAYVHTSKGQTSSHPISTGSRITDHFTTENKIISITGVISGVDIQTGRAGLKDAEGNVP